MFVHISALSKLADCILDFIISSEQPEDMGFTTTTGIPISSGDFLVVN